MKKMRKDNKGFTLVELIVVIVILAILAAILVPALLGYIDKAKAQQVVLNGKSVLTAAQADMSALYAKGGTHTASDITSYAGDIMKTADVEGKVDEIIVGCVAASNTAVSTNHTAFTINYVYYHETGKDAIEFDGSTWEKKDSPTHAADGKQYYQIYKKQ